MNPRIRALGETVLRVKDLQRVKRFYTDVVGLDILREFEGIAFLKVSNGHGGHTQIIGLFHESCPSRFRKIFASRFISSQRRCITLLSRSTKATLRPNWTASSAWVSR